MNDALRGLLDKDAETILAFAEANMRLVGAGEILGIDYRTIDNRLNYIYKRSKLNPKKFYDLCKLVQLLKGVEADDGSS